MNRFKNLKTDNFTAIFNDIHQQVREKMLRESQKEQAIEIQNILRQIKHTIKLLRSDTSSNIVNRVNAQLVALINQTFLEQIEEHESLNKATGLFNRSHFFKNEKTNKKWGVQSLSGYDDIFEEQLNYLLKAAAEMKGINITVPMGSGQEKATSSALKYLSKQMEQNILEITKKAAQNMKINVNKQKGVIGQQIITTAGKIDLKTPYFQVSTDATDIISKLLKVFSNKTFTLKNYATYTSKLRSLDQIDIHLGNTNLYKAITGGLSQIFSDPSDQYTIYYRGMQILSGQSQKPDTANIEIINSHFAHLRFMYELRGTGLITNNNNAVADFIIWNDPSSQNIVVRSTKDLVARYIDNYKNAFSAVSISASAL